MSGNSGPPGAVLVRCLADILTDPGVLEAPRAVAPRIAWAGRVTLLAAREKSGKSTLATAAAAAVSRGDEFLGEQVEQGRVLWVGLEEHLADLSRRFVAFEANAEEILLLEHVDEPIDDLRRAVVEVTPTLVVIDSLATFVSLLGPDSGSSAHWVPVMTGITGIARESGTALLALHHARRSDGRFRDSSAIAAGVDVVFEMEEHDAGVREVRARGRFPVDDFRVALRPSLVPHYELLDDGLTLPLEERVYRFVMGNPGASMRAVRDGVDGRASDIDRIARKLLRRGVFRDEGSKRRRALFACGVAETAEVPHGHSADAFRTHPLKRDVVSEGHPSGVCPPRDTRAAPPEPDIDLIAAGWSA